MKTESPDWSVAIFASRESPTTLIRCIVAALNACKHKNAVVDVLINGNQLLADKTKLFGEFKKHIQGDVILRIWFIPLGDKAHVWNEYLHCIWNGGTAYFIDGYAEVRENAMSLIATALHETDSALGATGVPTSGRSAEKLRRLMLKDGGIHGNFYAIKASTMVNLRQRRFRLPLGLYRTDALIGAVLVFKLDPSQHTWDMARMLVHPKATWNVRQSGYWKPKDIWGQCKRKLRQAQGVLENRAIRQHLAVEKLLPETLPPTVNQLVQNWIENHPKEARNIFIKRPLTLYPALQLWRPRNWSNINSHPILLEIFSN